MEFIFFVLLVLIGAELIDFAVKIAKYVLSSLIIIVLFLAVTSCANKDEVPTPKPPAVSVAFKPTLGAEQYLFNEIIPVGSIPFKIESFSFYTNNNEQTETFTPILFDVFNLRQILEFKFSNRDSLNIRFLNTASTCNSSFGGKDAPICDFDTKVYDDFNLKIAVDFNSNGVFESSYIIQLKTREMQLEKVIKVADENEVLWLRIDLQKWLEGINLEQLNDRNYQEVLVTKFPAAILED
ncbi:MAG: hypothetical protein AAF847_05685 [Bacteroidota bacterium]